MKKLLLNLISLVVLTVIIFMIASAGIPEKEEKATALYCCNIWDPRTVHPVLFMYRCFENGVEIEKDISYNCCYDAWHTNGWVAPVGKPCPTGACEGPPPDFH